MPEVKSSTSNQYRLWEASMELVDTELNVVGTFVNHLFDLAHPVTQVDILHQDLLSFTQRRRWRRSDDSMLTLLRSIGVVRDPQILDDQLKESLQPVPISETRHAVMAYINHTRRRIEKLFLGLRGEDQGEDKDILQLSREIYVDSRVLRQAAYERIYLIRA